MAKTKIFISHTSQETELAQLLKHHLLVDFHNALDIFVSSDRATILAGSNWLDRVSDALKEAQLVIVLCSRESIYRPWVNFEAGAGWIREIPIVPVCHSGLKLSDLPVPLSMLQAVEANQAEGLRKLYAGIAKILDWDAPEPDFETIVGEVMELEQKYMKNREAFVRIKNPRILCASTKQFSEERFGFNLDATILESKFPGLVDIRRDLTSERLRDILFTEQFDIIHLVLAVDPENGDIIFSRVDDAFKPFADNADTMSAAGFSNLLKESKSSLVVLATCNALLLAVEVAHIATMIASDVRITGEVAAKWEGWFYDFLVKGKSVYEAHALTKTYSDAPMRLVRNRDLAFSFSSAEA